MNIEELMLHTEALIFSSDRPLSVIEITTLLHEAFPEAAIDAEKLPTVIDSIVEKYSAPFYPFEIRQIGGGYQFLSKKEMYPTIAKLNGDKYQKKLSTAAMETLAIIAYKQPVTKAEIEHIRGVSSDYSIQKLLEKELIVISGRIEDAVGKPLTYNTSKYFMDYLGINSLDDLPKLSELSMSDEVTPTSASEAMPEYDAQLAVSEQGELVELKKADA